MTVDLLQGLDIDPGSLNALYRATHFGLGRTGAKAETFSRAGTPISAIASVSGNALYSSIILPAGKVVSNITVVTNSTAATTPTHQLAGLYSSTLAKLATSADGTTTAIAANSEITFAMTTPYTATDDDIFYLAVVVVSSGNPTFSGCAGHAALNALAPQPAFSDSTALTTALPATATVTTGAGHLYAYVS